MPLYNPVIPSFQTTKYVANLIQVAGTYTLCTANSGDIYIIGWAIHSPTAVTGLTSVAVKTNNTTPVTLLATTLLAALTGDTNLAQSNSQMYLKSSDSLQYTIVGTGTAGTLNVVVQYIPLAAGATLA